MSYTYIDIDSYYHASKNKYINGTLEQLIQTAKTSSNTTLEILNNIMRRLYFDIENIPVEKPELINEIIEALAKMVDIDPTKYALTINKHSSQHKGLSYHLYFPYKLENYKIRCLVNDFKTENEELGQYFDDCVYNNGRLFRLPEQKGCGFGSSEDDKHEIVHGTFEDCVIQNLNGLPTLEYRIKHVGKYIPTQKKFQRFNTSNPHYGPHGISVHDMMEFNQHLTQSINNMTKTHYNYSYIGYIVLIIMFVVFTYFNNKN